MNRPHESLNLQETQRLFATAIMRPMIKGQRIDPLWIDGSESETALGILVKPNARLTSLERTEIYNRQYWFRILDSFQDDFPGLRAVLGPRKFDRVATEYLIAHPSRSFTLRNLGRFLVDFLAARPELTHPRTRLALDMARFEWAQVEAFDGPSRPPITSDDLSRSDPAKLRFDLQPYLSLLDLSFPLDDFVLAVKKHAASRHDASNAVMERASQTEKRPKTHAKAVPLPRPKRTIVAVHRFDNELYYKRLDPDELVMLQSLKQGRMLNAACRIAIESSLAPDRPWIELLREWTATWTRLGWLCGRTS